MWEEAKKYNVQLSLLPTVTLNQMETIRRTYAAIGTPITNLKIMAKGDQLREHSITVKPTLTEATMEQKINFVVIPININRQIFK